MDISKETDYLIAKDPRFAVLLKQFGYQSIDVRDDFYHSLIKNIIYQQLSGKAALKIFSRFSKLLDGQIIPDQVLAMNDKKIRSVGLSKQKCIYIKDLSERCMNGSLELSQLEHVGNQAVYNMLIKVKGIGPWTIDMFLMFSLGRLDVFPLGDLGIKKGVRILCELEELPSEEELKQISSKWSPYHTIAALYMWKLVDGPFEW